MYFSEYVVTVTKLRAEIGILTIMVAIYFIPFHNPQLLEKWNWLLSQH